MVQQRLVDGGELLVAELGQVDPLHHGADDGVARPHEHLTHPESVPRRRYGPDVSIACGHCGGRHPTVAEVRSCSDDDPAAETCHSTRSFCHPILGRRIRRQNGRTATVDAVAGDLAVLAGPDSLGRALVVGPGGPAPAPWADAPRIVIDESTVADEAVAELTRCWTTRERSVVEVAVDLPDRPVGTESAAPWSLDADFTFVLDQLTHLGPQQRRRPPRRRATFRPRLARPSPPGRPVGGRPTSCCPTAGMLVRRRPARRRAGPPARRSPSSTASPRAGSLEPLGPNPPAADWRPTSWPPSPTGAAPAGSSPRPARARPAC